jgi:23S rRNA (adenine2030-N6)-methyltransferase
MPFFALDTHAGAGRYRFDPTAEEGEWKEGVGRLLGASDKETPAIIGGYIDVVQNCLLRHQSYPGSPDIIRQSLRPCDRACLCELHPTDFDVLEGAFSHEKHFAVLKTDGFAAVKSHLPPKERRGCILIDPSYELDGDYGKTKDALAAAVRRFPAGVYIVWYPLLAHKRDHKDFPVTPDEFPNALCGIYAGEKLRVELITRQPGTAGLYGSGLVIYNPPWTLKAAMAEGLPYLARILAGSEGKWSLA